MIKNDLEFKIHDDFVDWFDGLKGETSYFQCWMEGFKKGMDFNDRAKQPINIEARRADARWIKGV